MWSNVYNIRKLHILVKYLSKKLEYFLKYILQCGVKMSKTKSKLK